MKNRLRSYEIWLGVFLIAVATASGGAVRAEDAEPTVFQSGPAPVSLVELYTSEGCSSCLAAESWLSSMKADPNLWTRFVPVAFHVDYWDSLGWPDRVGSKSYSVRQRAQADRLGAAVVYTPQFIVNGREWRESQTNSDIPSSTATAVGTLVAKAIGPDQFVVTFDPSSPVPQKWEAHLAVLGFDIAVEVKGGENKGSTLHHDFAVIGFASAPLQASGTHFSAFLPSQPDANAPPGPRAIAVWITRAGELVPVQATGGFLTTGKDR